MDNKTNNDKKEEKDKKVTIKVDMTIFKLTLEVPIK